MSTATAKWFVCALLAAAQATGYRVAIEGWRQQHEAELKAEDGWLAVAGLFWLKEGPNSFGAAPSNDIVLPAGAAARAGVFRFQQGQTVLETDPNATVTLKGKRVTRVEMRPDSAGSPTMVALGDLTLHVIRRGTRFGIRLKDKNSKPRREFRGLSWFPVSPSYRATGRFHRYPAPKTLRIVSILGDVEELPSPGYVVFRVGGRHCRLEPVVSTPGELFFVLKDGTSGRGTYPGGRFLDVEIPKGEQIVLDFNKAYNPPCALNPYTTCPVPPRQNHLPVSIEAGEIFQASR